MTAVAELPVKVNGTKHVFRFPDEPTMKMHVSDIIRGAEYPVALPKGYVPEVVVDVGANVGAFAFHCASVFPNARILCFEPNPAAVAFLTWNLAPFKNVTICPWGLYDRDQQAALFEGAANLMQASMFANRETTMQTAAVEVRHAGRELARHDIHHISVLKLDTEGAELPIMKASGTMLEHVDQFYVEYHAEADRRAIDADLAGRGFVLARAQATYPHRGTCLYLSAAFQDRHPQCAQFEVRAS